MSGTAVATPGFFESLGKHPRGFWFIFWGELAERCSYYGMRAILARYMVEKLGFAEGEAATSMAIFIGACYFFPLIGGYVADNFFGKYWTIVGFSIPYILGHLVLGVESTPFLIGALALLAAGSGVIKPNISTLMGMTYDQQRPGDGQLRSDAFSIFYMAINIGATISQYTLPYLRTGYSYKVAFAFPAVLMVIAFIAFAAGKKLYAVDLTNKERTLSVDEQKNKGLIGMLIAVMGTIFVSVTAASILKSPALIYIGLIGFAVFAGTMWKVLGRLGIIFTLVSFFWAVFDQSSSTWIFFAKEQFQLDVNLPLYGMAHIEPDSIQSLNGFLIVVLVPLFAVLWRVFDKAGKGWRATDKMMLGFILTASTMLVMGVAGFVAADGTKVSILWQAGAYVLLTCAEVCISVVGLELAFVAAPAHMKSVVTACWLSCVAVANLCINAPIAEQYEKMSHGWYFTMLAAMMVPAIIAFWFVGRSFNAELARKKAAEAAVPGTPAVAA